MQLKRALGSKARLERLWDGTLYHPADLPFAENMNDMPDVFTPFRNKVSTCWVDPTSPWYIKIPGFLRY